MPPPNAAAEGPWWKDAAVYQIYPASFYDSNGDGIGDLNGIIQKLDYIKGLGIDVVWVCPHYDSPQVDMGYDIRDYQNIYPPYGTLADCERLISECHARGLRLIFDLVINHTSDQHKWFEESKSSKSSPKRDWYIWRPAKYDEQGNRKPPNNWRSAFSGSAWTWDDNTQEYYLHLFAPEQPDLNWENDETRKAIYGETMEFWLRKGVDGFRVDTVNMYSKGDLADAPVTIPEDDVQFAGTTYCNGPRMQEWLQEMNAILTKYDAMTVGECPHTEDIEKIKSYVSAKEKQLNMVFQFDVVDVGTEPLKTKPINWTLQVFKAAIARTQTITVDSDCWTTSFLENHDQSRSVSRFGNDSPEFRVASAKMLALMLVTLTGTLFVYQGQELGMVNHPLSWSIDEYKDVAAINYYEQVRRETDGDPQALEKAKKHLQRLGRDNARHPMQWDSSPHGGFSTAKPWMRVNDDFPTVNAAAQVKDADSVLAFWKTMLQLRKANLDTFVHGDFQVVDAENPHVFTYTKTCEGRRVVIVLNFTSDRQLCSLPDDFKGATLLMGTRGTAESDALEPYEGKVYTQ